MSTVTSFSGVQFCVPSSSSNSSNRVALFSSHSAPYLNFSGKSRVLGKCSSLKLKRKDVFFSRKTEKLSQGSRLTVRCDASSGRITQQDFTEMAWQAIVASPEIAKENKHQIVETEHLMKALLEQKNGLARRIFSKAGVDNTRLLEATDKFIRQQPKVIGETAGSMLGRELEGLMQRAREYKKEYGDSFVSVEHLVLGFIQDKRFGKQLFNDFQISLKTLKTAIESIRGRQNVIDQDPEGKYESLEKYGKDLTAMARAGKLDPVIGRDDEYTPPAANPEEEDLEIKLRRILECVPVRVSNTSGSSAGSGSGDFHQYRQMRRREQDRLARMDVDYQRRKEVAEFNLRREEKVKAAEERTAKKRARRQKKKQRKKEKKINSGAGGEEIRREESSDDDEADSDHQ